MAQYILIPDSFKGTISSGEICDIMSLAILQQEPNAKVISIPVADGGEGTVDAFLAAVGGKKVFAKVQGPYGKEMESFYALTHGGKTAVIEMAACAGLPLVKDQLNPHKTSTFGVGQLMVHAAQSGCQKIVLGLGGSATNDFGAGAAAAMGVAFYNAQGNSFVPVGGTLAEIAKVDTSGLLPAIAKMEIVVMCDIDNPLCGKNGAAHVFAPQKGANPQMVQLLDNGLCAACRVVQRDLGKDVANLPGAGAAGGMGGGMVAFLGAKLQMGIETVLDMVNFDSLLKDTKLVFTGEGKIDSQSLQGKVVIGVARRAKKQNVPVVAIVGAIGESAGQAFKEGVSGIFTITPAPMPFEEAKLHTKHNLAFTMSNLMHFIKTAKYTF